jgi:ferredoxin
VLGLAFPVYASFAPQVMRDFIRSLPPGGGKPLFALTSAGYVAGDTAWYATLPLADRGYEPFLFGNVVMGNNFFIPPMAILPVTPAHKMPRKLEQAEARIALLAERIHRRETHRGGVDPLGRLVGVLQRLSGEGFERKYFGPFYAGDGCTDCGWCVRYCPTGNIEQTEDGVRFLDRCQLCMRCYNFCPAQAIQVSKRTENTRRFRRYGGPENKRYPG